MADMRKERPILWSFRRCPYAIRARLAVSYAGLDVEERDILLKDKPAPFLAVSLDETVPVLQLKDQTIQESFDIMIWALTLRDPEHLMEIPKNGMGLIALIDGPFKRHLDHVKYAVRFPEYDEEQEREAAQAVLMQLDEALAQTPYIGSPHRTLLDIAIAPFVRQFANIERTRFDGGAWTHVQRWLVAFEVSDAFVLAMKKRPVWRAA